MSFLEDTLTITRKEIKIFLKQPAFGIARALIFPIIWIIFFAYGFGGSVNNIPLAVVMGNNGQYSQQLIDSLSLGDTLDISFTEYQKSLEDFQAKRVFAVLIIPEDFNNQIVSNNAKVYLLLDFTNPNVASAIKTKVESSANALSDKIIISKLQDGNILNSVSVEEEIFYGRGVRYLDFLAPGIIVQTIVFSAMFSGGISLLMDKEFGTLRSLMVAPISRGSIILGKTLGGVIQALLSGVVTFIIILLLGIKIKSSILLFLFVPLIMILLAFGFIGMSTVIATRMKRFEQFIMVTQILILPLWFVSGAIYPIQSMPNWMRVIASVNPMTYAVDAMRSVILRGIILESFLVDIIILIVFATIMFLLGVASFKRTIE